jgi:chromosome segregation ATPase
MGRKRAKNQNEVNENEQTIKDLKAANRRLKSDNQRLKAELDTLNEAFKKTSSYIKNNTDNVSVEKIIEGVKKGSTLEQIKKSNKCEACQSTNVKDLHVPNVGRIVLCGDCKHRKVLKNDKEEKK